MRADAGSPALLSARLRQFAPSVLAEQVRL